MKIEEEIKSFFRGDVASDEATRATYSRDASLFEIMPRLVVFPRDAEDIKKLVAFVAQKKKKGENISLTARSAGTDMTGGPLSESIVVQYTKYMNHLEKVDASGYAITEPGVYYRDFEKETLRQGLIFPSYPASKELCALGGILANNSGGEKSLIYGKTEEYVESLNVVLADGNECELKRISEKELKAKMKLRGFEGQVYKKMHKLLEANYDAVKSAKPDVSKNSSGYNVWDVWDGEYFDLTKLFVGSQGTLGLITKAKIRLVKTKPYSAMLVIFTKDLAPVADIVRATLPFKPTSFESFDDHTLKLAMRFLPEFIKFLGSKNMLALGLQFFPEFWMVATSGFPKLILLAEFEGESQREVQEKVEALNAKLKPFHVRTRIAPTKEAAQKYWVIRRESFNLLRHKVRGKQTAPFIDDFIVKPDRLPEFLPKIYEILDRYHFLYTIAGHVGNGNFHIIPLMTLAEESERAKIPKASAEVYDLVVKFGGSLSAEHNDGLVRGPYLQKMYGKKIMEIFREVKRIFDPLGILNPGKKIEADIDYAFSHIKRS